MSYSFDTDGWELFSTPFSTAPVRTAPTPPKQQTERQQQNPSKTTMYNAMSTQKAPQPSKQATDTQKPSAVQQSKPAPTAAIPAPDEKPAPTVQTQANTAKPEPASPPKASVPASTPPVTPQKELVLDMTSGTAPAQDDTQKRKAHEESGQNARLSGRQSRQQRNRRRKLLCKSLTL